MAGHQDGRYIPPRRERDRSPRRGRDPFAIRWVVLPAIVMVVVALVALVLTYWSAEPEYSDQQRACIAQRYPNFDAKKLSQCVDVCKACMNGNTATCNTSCKLKGAS
jgi:hypothetical protein